MFGSFNRHNRTGAEAVFAGLVRSVGRQPLLVPPFN